MESENKEIENKEVIKKDIRERTDDRRPISYTKRARLKRVDDNKLKYQEAQEIFFKYQEFYEVHYPKSTHDLEWTEDKLKIKIPEGDFEETLNRLSELELYHIVEVLLYGRKEFFSGDMKEHYQHIRALSLITTRIPGYKEQAKLKKLKNEKHEQEKLIAKLDKLIKQKRLDFSKAHGEKIKNEPETKIFVCKVCDKQCARASGLSSHQRSKHPELFEND